MCHAWMQDSHLRVVILSFVAIGGFENDGIVLFLFQQWTNAQDGLKFDMVRSRCWFRRPLSTSAACRHSIGVMVDGHDVVCDCSVIVLMWLFRKM